MDSISIVDAIIILFILLGGVIGFKEGAIKKLTGIIGLILVVGISFILKNKLSVLFYENLPFFGFFGFFKGIQVVNIIFYELLAFLIIMVVLILIYRLLLTITGIIEKVLKATVILSIPSKIIGFFIGLIEYYIIAMIALIILTLPFFRIDSIYNSHATKFILNNTPIVSKYSSKIYELSDDLYYLFKNNDDKTKTEINEEALNVMLKYDFITVESCDKLIEQKKIDVDNTYFIDRYR